MREASRQPGALHLWWLGQSGFLLMYQDRQVVLDPYLSDSLTEKYAGTDKPHVRMTARVIHPGSLNATKVVTSSHNHTDHLDAATLRPLIRVNGQEITIVAPEANRTFVMQRLDVGGTLDVGTLHFIGLNAGQHATIAGFEFTAVPAAHDRIEMDEQGYHRYLGYVVRCGGRAVYHSGDTVVYDGMAEHLRPFNVDVALLPINGKVGNMGGRDAARLAKDIGAKLVVPCHYEMFEFNTADPRDEFIPECERIGQQYKVLRAGERLTLGASAAPT